MENIGNFRSFRKSNNKQIHIPRKLTGVPGYVRTVGTDSNSQSHWLNDSFPGLLLPDQIWGEAIKALRLWEEWSPTGLVRDPVFCWLLHNGVWDSCESGRPAAEVMAMRHSAALLSRLILRALEQEEKVLSSFL